MRRFLLALILICAVQQVIRAQEIEALYYKLDSLYLAEDFETLLKHEKEITPLLTARQDTLAINLNFLLADAYLKSDNIREALPYFIKAKDISETFTSQYPEMYHDALFNLMFVYFQDGNDREAVATGKTLINYDKRTFGITSEEYVYTLLQYVDVLIQVDHITLAETELKEASSKISKDSNYYGLILGKLATLYSYTGQYSKSTRYFLDALKLLRAKFGEQSENYQLTLANYGYLLTLQGKFDKAEQELNTALTAIRNSEWPDKDLTYYAALNNLSLAYQSLGQYEAAELSYHEILKSDSATIGLDHPDFAVTLSNLGLLYTDEQKFQEAERVLQAALNIMRTNDAINTISYARKLNNLAKTYQHWGQPRRAIPLLEEALKIFETQLGPKSPDYATALFNLGVAHLQSGSAKSYSLLLKAKDLRAKALGKSHPLYAESLEKIAIYKWQKKKNKEVSSLYKQVFLNYYGQVENFFPVLTEEEKANLYFNKIRPSVDTYASWVVDSKASRTANADLYTILLNTKGLILYATDKVKQKIMQSGDTSLITLFEQWESQKELLAFYYSQSQNQRLTDSLTVVSKALEKELSIRSAEFNREILRPKRSWQEIQKVLKPEEAAIEIIRFRKYNADSAAFLNQVYYAALILTAETKDGPELVLLKNGTDLESRFLNYYRNGIQFKMDDAYSYKNYWEAIHDKLKQLQVKSIYLSADGAYNLISANTIKNPLTGKYLIEELEIKTVTSTRDLVEAKPKISGHGYLLFGFPTYSIEGNNAAPVHSDVTAASISRSMRGSLSRFLRGENGIPPLPGTKDEVMEIQEILKDKSSAVFLENDASEEKIKKTANPKVLHIATHGYFLEDNTTKGSRVPNPLLNSGLILAGASNFIRTGFNPIHNGDDGILTSYEAMNLDLEGTELVILSACETGLGHQRNGEGVYGLQRALYLAGAKTIVMSLWSVDDEATSNLMSTFYAEWQKTGDVHKSFHEAQKKLMQKFPHPYYWGAFVMVGL